MVNVMHEFTVHDLDVIKSPFHDLLIARPMFMHCDSNCTITPRPHALPTNTSCDVPKSINPSLSSFSRRKEEEKKKLTFDNSAGPFLIEAGSEHARKKE